MKSKSLKTIVVALSALLLVFSVVAADGTKNAAASPYSDAFGQNFENWLRDFWAWNFGGVGDQIQKNNVMFLQVPAPGELQVRQDNKVVAIGEMDVTVKPGTKLVLGILAWIGETYDPALNIPDDQAWTIDEFLPPKGEAVITLDGVELINSSNLADFYYGPVEFKEPIMYPQPSSYGSIGAIWVQGIGIVIKPLPVGEHTLTLYSWDLWGTPVGSPGQGWFNTWHITVEPPNKK